GKPACVELLPANRRSCGCEIAVELNESVHEVASHGTLTEQVWKLRQVEQPVRVPRRPVRIVPVRDPVDEVVLLGRLLEECRDGLSVHAAATAWGDPTARSAVGRMSTLASTKARTMAAASDAVRSAPRHIRFIPFSAPRRAS